jgi:uncharacterized protein
MKLHEQMQARMNLIGRYGAGELQINGRSLTGPLLVGPGFLQENWIAGIDLLTADQLEPVWQQHPRIVLLGSDARPGAQLKPLRRLFADRQVALEVMDLGAACRTYNVLAQEDRAVRARSPGPLGYTTAPFSQQPR